MRMTMKMAAVSKTTLLLLCCSIIFSADAQDECSYVKTGDNFVVPLSHQLTQTEKLRWTLDGALILDRKPVKSGQSMTSHKFVKGSQKDIYQNGSLKLTNVKKERAGKYKPEIFREDGMSVQNLKVTQLCVLDHVPQPKVKIECVSRNVNLSCTVDQFFTQDTSGLTFQWLQNGKVLGKEKRKFLIQGVKAADKHLFSCKVSNPVSSMTSEPATPNCIEHRSFFPEKILGINTWIIVGSGGGIVLLLIIFVVVYCVLAKRKKRMRLKDEEELRLEWTNSEQHHCHQRNPPHDHHHHNHHQQQPAGHTGPRQHRSKQHREVQRPRATEPYNGQPQPSPRRAAQTPKRVACNHDEQLPPLPQPRKKAPATPRV
ncbi:T-cell surface antigen CD2-like [Xiphias gladius]|uniref:T-cell surface antigen CD2-like n=1 Tax=Xiphias gladius TaxID=8245 RepID=UPI001A99E41E|nr:T-cell surface antigen CD2-like [Xiphias gladius]